MIEYPINPNADRQKTPIKLNIFLQFEEASESESVDTNTSERSTLRDCVRDCVRGGPGADEMDRSSNSTGPTSYCYHINTVPVPYYGTVSQVAGKRYHIHRVA